MARLLAKILIGLLITATLFVGVCWWILRPAEPLALGSRLDVLADVNLVNPGLDRLAHQQLVFRDGLIAEITDAKVGAADSDLPERYAGAFVLPGLIDMHVHYPPLPLVSAGDTDLFNILFLRYGVTTVRVTGSAGDSIFRLRQRVRDGEAAAPRIFTCGPILDGDPPAGMQSKVVRDPGEAIAAVEELAAKGVDCIKVYNNMPPEVLASIGEASASHGIPVIGHLPTGVAFEEAAINDVQHLTGVPELPRKVFADIHEWFVAQERAWEQLDATRIDAVVAASLRNGMVHTPTLVAWHQGARRLDNPEGQHDSATGRLLPRYYRDVLWAPRVTSMAMARTGRRIIEKNSVVEALYHSGVRVHLGSDTPVAFVVPGVSIQQELEEFVRAGLTAEEAWVAGTRWPGEFLGMPGLGTIAQNAPADLLIFREDPTQDLMALETLEAVVAAGRLYTVAELEEALVRQRDRFESRLFDALTVRLGGAIIKRLVPKETVPQDERRAEVEMGGTEVPSQ